MKTNRPQSRTRKAGADRPGILKTLLNNQKQANRQGDPQDLAARATGAWWRWTMKAPESRLPAAGIAALYPAGGVADALNPVPWELGAFALPAAGAAWVSTWKAHGSKEYSAAVTAGAAAVPLWLATASITGIGNMNTLLAYTVAGTASWGSLRWSDVLRARRAMRAAQVEWKTLAGGIEALEGSRMISKETTPFGERFVVDIRATRSKTAARFPREAVAHEVAALFGVPEGRVTVSKMRTHAGMVTISVKLTDPWKTPPVSPAVADTEVLGRSIMDGPLVLGADPETGKPIELTVYNVDGGRHTMIVATTRGGKTNLFSCVVEQATARRDVLVMSIDLGGGTIPSVWGEALDASAGVGEVDKALCILGWLKTVMEERTRRSGGIEHKPSPTAPVILLVLDEASAAIGFSADRRMQKMQQLVNEIFQRGAKAGVVIATASQRGTSSHTGSRDPHANAGNKILLRVASTSEMGHIVPDWQGAGLPDMSSYGQGSAGVVCVVEPDMSWTAGRSYHLDHKRDVPQGIARRRGAPTAAMEPWLVEKLPGYADRRPTAAPAVVEVQPASSPARAVELDQDAVDREFVQLMRDAGPAPEPKRERNVLELVIEHPEPEKVTGPPEEFIELVLGLLTQSDGKGVRLEEIVDAGTWGRTRVKAWLGQLREAGIVAHNGQATKAARWILPPE
jgi:hypothetical protein